MTRSKASPRRSGAKATKSPTFETYADEVFDLQDEIDRLEAKAASLRDLQTAKKKLLHELMGVQGLDSIRVPRGTVGLESRQVAQIGDWNEVVAFVKKHDAFDLFNRRLTSKAVFDRIESGVRVPGVKIETIVSMKLTRSKAK